MLRSLSLWEPRRQGIALALVDALQFTPRALVGPAFGMRCRPAGEAALFARGLARRNAGLALTRTSKCSSARVIRSVSPSRINFAGLPAAPLSATLPLSTACFASCRVLKKRAAQSQMSSRTEKVCDSMP